MRPRIHTERALRDIADVLRHVQDDIAQWYKVNWIIVQVSHDICKTKGRLGHVRRQVIRHRLWRMAKRRYSVLERYAIPVQIEGNSGCTIKQRHKVSGKSKKPRWKIGKYYQKNVPALISAIMIGVFITLIPIIDRKTIYENISQILTFFNQGILNICLILTSVALVLTIFCLFLSNGLGYLPNRYSKFAGYLSIVYLFLLIFENFFLVENATQVSVFGIVLISYWIVSFGVSTIGILYLIFFEVIGRNKENQWKIAFFTIICAITFFLIGIIIPVIFSSREELVMVGFFFW